MQKLLTGCVFNGRSEAPKKLDAFTSNQSTPRAGIAFHQTKYTHLHSCCLLLHIPLFVIFLTKGVEGGRREGGGGGGGGGGRGGGQTADGTAAAERCAFRCASSVAATGGKVRTMSPPSSETVLPLDSSLIWLPPLWLHRILQLLEAFFFFSFFPPSDTDLGAQQLRRRGDRLVTRTVKDIRDDALIYHNLRRHLKATDELTESLSAPVTRWSLKPAFPPSELLPRLPDDGRQTLVKDFHTWSRSFRQHMKGRRSMLPRSLPDSSRAMGSRHRTKIQHHSRPISKIYFVFILLLLIFTPRVDSSWWWVHLPTPRPVPNAHLVRVGAEAADASAGKLSDANRT